MGVVWHLSLIHISPNLRICRLALCYLSLALAAASALLMGVGSALTRTPELGDPSRWYFGTDSHATGLALSLIHI